MIIGSVYLGKKARKAYKKRQAEKAAKQLVGGIEVADPSDELILKAPPGSPIERVASSTSIYSTTEPSSAWSRESYPNGSKSALTPSSTYSSSGPRSVPIQQTDAFVRYEQRELSNEYPEQPPSYDVALNSPRGEGVANLGHMAHASMGHLHIDSVQDSVMEMDNCPTCIALLRQRHLHHHNWTLHNTQAERPIYARSPTPQMIHSEADISRQTAVVAELPAEQLGYRIAELADTSPSVELPAEVPSKTSQRRGEGPTEDSADENKGEQVDSRPVELPAEIDLARSDVT